MNILCNRFTLNYKSLSLKYKLLYKPILMHFNITQLENDDYQSFDPMKSNSNIILVRVWETHDKEKIFFT